MINNETGGKPVLMTYNMNPKGGTDANSTKPGSGPYKGTTAYGLRNPDTYYRVTGGPTLGNPMGGPDENASTRTARPLARNSAPNMRLGSGGRNNES